MNTWHLDYCKALQSIDSRDSSVAFAA